MIDPSMTYKERKRNPRFADASAQAEEDSVQILEAEARRRAMSVSDTLLIFLLKADRPEKYRDRTSVDMRVDIEGAVMRTAAQLGVDTHAVMREVENVLAGAEFPHGDRRPPS